MTEKFDAESFIKIYVPTKAELTNLLEETDNIEFTEDEIAIRDMIDSAAKYGLLNEVITSFAFELGANPNEEISQACFHALYEWDI